MQDRLSFSEEAGPDALTRVLVARGDVDVVASGYLSRWVEAALREGCRHLVVDLTEAGYLDTRALDALISAERTAGANGATLTVVSPADSRLRVIFELTRLDRYLQLSDSRAEAFADVA